VTDGFRRYLRAKRTVDDRALDRRTFRAFSEAIADRAAATDGPLSVVEVGAGIGTMIARLVERDALPAGEIRYTAVDVDAETLAGVEPYLREWAADRAVSIAAASEGRIELRRPNGTVEIETVAADAAAHAVAHPGEYDVLVGAALLDLLGLDAVDALLGALAAGGLCYFPITFDGATRFRPSHPADGVVEERYHAHMDAKPGGSSRAGGDVLDHLRATPGVAVSSVGGSDWVVRPIAGEYPADEAYFLRHVIDTVESAVGEMLAAAEGADTAALERWLADRRERLEAGELLYLTHQLDLLGRVERPAAGEREG
jgi:hypothetical protein